MRVGLDPRSLDRPSSREDGGVGNAAFFYANRPRPRHRPQMGQRVMTRLTRRNFGRLAAAGLTALAAPALSAAVRPRVVIIGGGAGGAPAAQALTDAANGKVSITLIEPNAIYHSCFGSNLAIGGFAASRV
jgi:hypothetical protein